VYDPDEPAGSGKVVRAMYDEQITWAVQEGADLIISETNDYLGEALIALEVIRAAGVPAVVTFASTMETTIDGVPLPEACRRLADAGAAVVGLNCSRGPATMLGLLEDLRAGLSCQLAAQPVPFRTTPEQPTFQALVDRDGRHAFPIALDPFTCTRFEMADFALAARDLGVGYIGICCGGAPHHVRAMAEALGREVPASRYSPDMSLHPVLGEASPEHAERFAHWRE
jgi:betaine-homocysteine S-methyltransferase